MVYITIDVSIPLVSSQTSINTELNYNQVIRLLRKSECDSFIQQVIILLQVVHDEIREKSLRKSDFVFTQFKEGHILVTKIKEHF